ncbi:MAG: FliA/WhiG family RNA polymerase sigma factor [bacterium]
MGLAQLCDQEVLHSASAETEEATARWEAKVAEYLPLVRYVALQFVGRLPAEIELDDIADAGVVGLIDALTKFDPLRQVQFQTYAQFRIRGAILDELRNLDWAPRSLRSRVSKLKDACARLEQSLGRRPDESELAAFLELDPHEIRSLLEAAHALRVCSLDPFTRCPNGGTGHKPLESLVAPETCDPRYIYARKERRRLLKRIVEGLPPVERYVVWFYYFEEITMRKIGELLGVSESRISQIHSKAVRRLRKRVARLALA